ncbi:adenylate/guanylate cyclase domain-containing protein [uncultured Tateyamaria sp.]|uniref:adenylate/guanylate cyclase domain-containing protein n=1 Tax=uncultured Tateyamaria sp. TaxID=455651 RepID=UPI002618164F|nr:adenylate/guanylate cyclase domain-containing protein [uncultured Tateyamaria sp.]
MVSELDEWLQSHDLADYSEVFAKQDVRFNDLPHLTEGDLKELGMPIGARRRLLVAIAKLDAEPPQAKATGPHVQHSGAPEVRHLTFLFADISGSTQLSEDLDIEAYRDLLHGYQTACAKAVEGHHGHLAQFQGDGVVAYFGYPAATEDDAERAVFAGLQICRTVASMVVSAGTPIKVRVGIATGDVVVDTREGHRVHALGEAANLAARIQSEAAPGTVAVSDETRSLLGANFDCELAGKYELKGFSDPANIWIVRGAHEARLRFQSRQHGKITPIVNRQDELLLLKRRWDVAQTEGLQVVMLCGEAGIGKSRLVEELSNGMSRDTRWRLSFQCLPNHSASAFHPVIAFIVHAARILRTDDTARRIEKLTGLLSGWTDQPDTVLPVFARLLSVPPSLDQIDNPPEEMKGQLRDALVGIVRHLARTRPLLIQFEDLHWIDPSSEELFDMIIEGLEDAPVLAICTYRPDYKPRWIGLAGTTSLTISRLETRYSRQMVRNMIAHADVPPELETQIIHKTDGVPLFLEEMTRMVDQRLAAAHAGVIQEDALSLPATLKDLLRAQIDKVSAPQDFVSLCAVIGRSIMPEMLEKVTSETKDTVQRMLGKLIEAQILVRRRNGDGTRYFFRHALIQDAVYDLMLPSKARALHERVAETLARHFPEIATRMPEQLAHHYTLSGLPAKARDAWHKAAQRAASQVATEETIQHLQFALAENDKIEDELERNTQEIELRRFLNLALNTHAFGSLDVRENRDRLHELLRKTSASAHDIFLGLTVQYGTQLMLGDTESALNLNHEMRQIAEATDDTVMAAISAHSEGMTRFMSASFDDAMRCFAEALELRKSIKPDAGFAFYSADIRAVDTAMAVWAQVCRGDEHPSLQEALLEVIDEPHDFSQCYALSILAAANQMVGDVETVIRLSEAALEISEKRKFQYWSAWSGILHGWAVACAGDPSVGAEKIVRAIDDYVATGSTQMTLYARTLLADAWYVAGDIETGLSIIASVRADPLAKTIRYQTKITEIVEAKLRTAAETS